MVQHLMLLMVAPPLLIAGQPLTLLLHASRNPLHTWAKRVLRSRGRELPDLAGVRRGGVCARRAGRAPDRPGELLSSGTRQRTTPSTRCSCSSATCSSCRSSAASRSSWRLSYPVRFVMLVLLMPVDTFTGLALGYGSASSPGVPAGPRPAWAPSPVSDLHLGGA